MRNKSWARIGGTAAPIALAAALLLVSLASCQTPFTPITTQRTISFDVSSLLFGDPNDPNPGKQGPGIDTISVTLTVTGSDGKDSTLPAQSFAASSLSAGAAYGNFGIVVTGALKSIHVDGTKSGAPVVGADVSSIPADEVTRYNGWTGFANVTYFKVTWSGGSASTGTIRVLPCPRSAATLLVDSGVQSGAGNTDLASSVQSGQIALQVNPSEDTANGDLTYDIYFTVAKIDPSVKYNDALLSGSYLSDPWTAQWTYGEVTGSAGKKIGPDTYVMTKYSGGPFTAGKPDANGKYAILIDLTKQPNYALRRYLLYCVVFTRGDLSVPSDVGSVEIQ